MPAWSRTILPMNVTPMTMGGALQSRGQSGKSQRRATTQAGRIWKETYKPFKLNSAAGRAFVAMIMDYWRNGTAFTIDHRSYLTPFGAGTGTPLVNGAGQTGSTLNTDGWTGSNPVLKAGDIIKIAGVPGIRDITADAPNLVSGACGLSINPPIFVGKSPADNAVITYTGVLLDAFLLSGPEELVDMPPNGYVAGLTLTFVEAL